MCTILGGKHILGAALVSNVGGLLYIVGVARGMGVEWFFNPLQWDVADTFTIVSTMIPLLAKLVFVLDVGGYPR